MPMKFEYDIKFTDNTPQLHEALDLWAERVLTIWGMKVQDYAQLLVPTGTADSTGIFAEKGNGRKTPWVWKDFNGKWHFTRGMAPRPFLRPAVEEHIDELREIAVEEGNKEV